MTRFKEWLEIHGPDLRGWALLLGLIAYILIQMMLNFGRNER